MREGAQEDTGNMRSDKGPENSEATLQLLGADAREGEEKAIVTERLCRGLCNPGCFPRGLDRTRINPVPPMSPRLSTKGGRER